jgi:hypothetical protein
MSPVSLLTAPLRNHNATTLPETPITRDKDDDQRIYNPLLHNHTGAAKTDKIVAEAL